MTNESSVLSIPKRFVTIELPLTITPLTDDDKIILAQDIVEFMNYINAWIGQKILKDLE